MAQFDSTIYKSIEPRNINPTRGVVSQAGRIDTSAYGAIESGIKMVQAIDEEQILNKAEEKADTIANEYLSRSPSEQIYLQNRQKELQSEIDSGIMGDDKDQALQELDIVNTKLAKAKAQGVMSPFEFNRRVNMEGEKVFRERPYLRDKIIARVNRTVQDTGVYDAVAADEALKQARLDNAKSQYEYMVKIVEPFIPGSPYNLSKEQLESEFYRIKGDQAAIAEIYRQVEVNGTYNYKDFLNNGGPAFHRKALIGNLNTVVYTITQNDADFPTADDKLKAINMEIESSESEYLSLISSFDDTALKRKDVEAFKQGMDKYFETLKADSKDRILLTNTKTYLSNKKSIYDDELEIQYMQQFGQSRKAEENLIKKVELWTKLANARFLDTETSKAIKKDVQKLSMEVFKGVGRFTSTELDEMETDTFSQLVAETTKTINTTSEDADVNMITSYLAFVNDKSTETEAGNKLQKYDTNLTALARITDEQFKRLLSNQDFQLTTVEALRQYKGLTNVSLKQLSISEDITVTLVDELGLLQTSSANAKFKGTLDRVNTYIRVRAKMLGKHPKDVAKQILDKDFADTISYGN